MSIRPDLAGTRVRNHSLLTNLALATLSLGLCLIVAELVLRSIIPMDARQPTEFRIPDPVLGWVLKPNASYLYALPEGAVHVTYNSQGWHDIEHTVKKPAGVFRILVLGDSFMEAYSVGLNAEFSRQVEVLAREAGSNTEVINMGVAGYGTLQDDLVYEDIGQQYQPDLVVLAFFDWRDLWINSPELAPIMSPVGGVPNSRPFLDPNQPTRWTITPVDYADSQRDYAANEAALEAQRNQLTEKLALLRLARAGISSIQLPEFLKGSTSAPAPIDQEQQEMASLGVNYCAEPPEFTRAWDTTERILAKFKGDVEANNSKLVVFNVPALSEVSVDYIKEVTARAAYPTKLCLEEAPANTRLSQMLTKLDIEQIPLLADFRTAVRANGKQLYLSDLHWNAAGHALAAERVVSALTQRGLLPITGK